MTLKVGILGLAGAGKDTFASMLQEELSKLGHDFKIDRYARPIKELTADIFNLTLDELEDRVLKEAPRAVSTTHLLRTCSTFLLWLFQDNHEDYTVAMELLQAYFTSNSHNTLTTVRLFQQYFGTDVVRAVRPNAWVDILQERDENLIVPDVRFENELCDANLLIIRQHDLPRPVHTSEHYAWDLGFSAEHDLPKNTRVVGNIAPTSLDALRVQASKYAQRIKNKL